MIGPTEKAGGGRHPQRDHVGAEFCGESGKQALYRRVRPQALVDFSVKGMTLSPILSYKNAAFGVLSHTELGLNLSLLQRECTKSWDLHNPESPRKSLGSLGASELLRRQGKSPSEDTG